MPERTVWYGMKLSEEERATIRRRAASQGKSSARYLLDLVEKDTEKPPVKKRRLTGAELLALPAKEQDRLLFEAAKKARKDYLPGGALRIFEANDPILEY
jgi:thymidylate synthase ThyX